MTNAKLDAVSFGLASAIVSGITMILLGILGNIGIYTGAFEMMKEWHMFFSLSFGGILLGTIEAFIIGFIFAYLFARMYNALVK